MARISITTNDGVLVEQFDSDKYDQTPTLLATEIREAIDRAKDIEAIKAASLTYPDVHVQLIGQDGNAFVLIGLTAAEIRKTVGPVAATQFTHDAMDCESYEALLNFIQRSVNVH